MRRSTLAEHCIRSPRPPLGIALAFIACGASACGAAPASPSSSPPSAAAPIAIPAAAAQAPAPPPGPRSPAFRDLACAAAPPAPDRDACGDPLPPGAALRLGNARLSTGSPAHALLFSKAGDMLVSGHRDGSVAVWDAATGVLRGRFPAHRDAALSLALSPAGDVLATGGGEGRIGLWSFPAGARLHTLDGYVPEIEEERVAKMRESLGRGGLGWGGGGLGVGPPPDEQYGAVTGLSFAPHGKALASVATGALPLRFWDPATGRLLTELPLERVPQDDLIDPGPARYAGYTAVAYPPSGDLFAAASGDHRLRLWNRRTDEVVQSWRDDLSDARSMAFSADGRLFAASGPGSQLRVWESAGGRQVASLYAPGKYLALSSNGGLLATWDHDVRRGAGYIGGRMPPPRPRPRYEEDWMVSVFELPSGRRLAALKGHEGDVLSAAFAPGTDVLVSTSKDGGIRAWDARRGQELPRPPRHDGGASQAAWSPDGGTMATIGADPVIRLWDAGTGALRRAIEVPRHTARWVAFSPDGREIVATGWREVRRYDAATGQELGVTPLDRKDAQAAPPAELVVERKGEAFEIRRPSDAVPLRRVDRAHCRVTSAALSPDGRRLVTTCADGTSLVWSVAAAPGAGGG